MDVRSGLANSLAQLGRWQEAWDEFSRIPEQVRRRSDVGFTMALTAHRLGKEALAKDIFKATEASDSDQSYAASIRRLLGE